MQQPIKSSLAKELDAISEKTKEEGNISGFELTINITMKMIHPQIGIVKTMMMLILKMLMVLKKKRHVIDRGYCFTELLGISKRPTVK